MAVDFRVQLGCFRPEPLPDKGIQAEVGLVVNINGSPYELNKDDVRLALVARRAAEANATIAYVNMVGGQDELVFDGDSMIVTAQGELLAVYQAHRGTTAKPAVVLAAAGDG